MPIADLLKDKAIRDHAKGDIVRDQTADFVKRRARQLIREDSTLEDPNKPRDLTPAATTQVRPQIVGDLKLVRDAHKEIAKRVNADKAHIDIGAAGILSQVSSRPPQSTPKLMRANLLVTIVHQASAQDITLAEPANIDRLHILCDRKLRIVERMLYHVGKVEEGDRRWSTASITAHKGGPWTDGHNRMFEYPKVPQNVFLEPCNADPSNHNRCAVPMSDWKVVGSHHLEGPIRVNPDVRPAWVPSTSDDYLIRYTPGTDDTVTAIQKLFKPSTDYLDRNLLYCDHTIHCLHHEALVFSRQKRLGTPSGPPSPTWLDDEVAAKPRGWLRIHVPFFARVRFLAGAKETVHFAVELTREEDLQPGDHLRVFNHPAYEHGSVGGAWKLENAVVVQTLPVLRMQGHGIQVLGRDDMWAVMLKLFKTELDDRRADVDGLATVTSIPKNTTNQVQVDSIGRLRRGMHVEIANPDTDDKIAEDREITAINRKTGVVTYDGANAPVKARNVLRRVRDDSLGPELITLENGVTILRIADATTTDFAGRARRADWFLTWRGSEEEHEIRIDPDPTRRDFIQQTQGVIYIEDAINGPDSTLGLYPLWKAAADGKQPVVRNGKIVSSIENVPTRDQIAGWDRLGDPNPRTEGQFLVIRPQEP